MVKKSRMVQSDNNSRSVRRSSLQGLIPLRIRPSLLKTIRYIISYLPLILSVDLLLIHKILAWVIHCEKRNRLKQLSHLRSNQRWRRQVVEKSIAKFRDALLHNDFLSRNAIFLSKFDEIYQETNKRIKNKWGEVIHWSDSGKSPPFYQLCMMEQQELQGLISSTNMPFIFRACLIAISYVLVRIDLSWWEIIFIFLCFCRHLDRWGLRSVRTRFTD